MPGKPRETFEVGKMTMEKMESFEPQYEIDGVSGYRRASGDEIRVDLIPRNASARVTGKISLRFDAVLLPGSPLATFATMIGQDPKKGFDPNAARGIVVALSLSTV